MHSFRINKSMKGQLCIIICISVIALGGSNEVCDNSWPKCGGVIENIVCTRGESCEPEPNCEDIPADPDFLKFILEEHNRLRNEIASGNDTRNFTGAAANMRSLSYDKDLEYSARCNVNTCKFEHDKCRGTKTFRYAGQNMYFTTASKEELKNSVKEWYKEIKLNTADVIDKFPKGRHDIGHFTQVIWAKTTKIGCALAKSNADEQEKFFITCNYGPTGNSIGKNVYERGEGCSKCPPDVKCNEKYPALCGEIDESEIYGPRNIFSSKNDAKSKETNSDTKATPDPGKFFDGDNNKVVLNGVPGMYDNGIAGIPLDSFKGMFIDEPTVLEIKGYGISGLYGTTRIFGGDLLNFTDLALCQNGGATGKGRGLFINGNFIPGTLIGDTFVSGTFFKETFFPGLFINGKFLPGVFFDKVFLPGNFINDVFIPGAFINKTFVPGALINSKFSPGELGNSKIYNAGIILNGTKIPGISGLYNEKVKCTGTGSASKSSFRFVLSMCLILLCFWKVL